MIGRIVRWGILLYVLYVAAQGIPIYWHYQQLRDEVGAVAHQGDTLTDEEILERVLAAAERHHVPLAADAVAITRGHKRTRIGLAYVEQIRLAPGRRYHWRLEVTADSWAIRGPF